MKHRCLPLLGLLAAAQVSAQSLPQPTYTLVESAKKVYGRASHDFRAIGVVDYWWIGHDATDGPFAAIPGSPRRYAATQSFALSMVAVDGTNMDRHGCGFMHLNDDAKIDMICSLGAEKGTGSGPNEVYRNDSTPSEIRMTRIEGAQLPTGIEDSYGRGRAIEPFRFADGSPGVWSVVHGTYRLDSQPNVNRLFRYNGSGSFKFTEVPSVDVNITTTSTCAEVGDLNGDGLDDLLLCRPHPGDAQPSDSLLFLQSADGTFHQTPLTTRSKQFVTAEIADLNSDGRSDLVVSIDQAGETRIEIYLQTGKGKLPTAPAKRVATSAQVKSIAVGDLDGDGKPDIYAAVADNEKCEDDFDKRRTMNDTWPDLVLSTRGAGAKGYQVTSMVNEPVQRGCSWMADWVSPGVIHLGRGLDGTPGDNYALQFGAAPR